MLNAAPHPVSGSMYHPALGQVRYSLQETSDDPDQQVADTIGLMRTYANQDAANPILQEDVARAWQSDDAIGDTFAYLRRDGARGMRFVRDESTGQPFEQGPGGWRPIVEALIRPADQALLANPQGDCDDFAQYGAGHLLSRGVPCSYATVGVDSGAPQTFTHVYLVAYPKDGPYAGQRVPMDLSHGPHPGWEVPNPFGKFREWPLSGGLGIVGWGFLAVGGYLIYRALKGVN